MTVRFRLDAHPRVAIAGATGAVGRELVALLAEGWLQPASLKLLASERSAGKRIGFRDAELEVEALSDAAFDDVDLALFSCGKERSLRFARAATERGAVVVDNSSAFRLEPDVPLVVPEVNGACLRGASGQLASRVVANPNCSTILLVVVLAPLVAAFGLRRAIVSTYQAASGAGARGVEALLTDTRSALDAGAGAAVSPAVFGQELAFNVVPQIDRFVDPDRPSGAVTGEERKVVFETRKILGAPDLPMDVTCVRVPVLRCHSESVTIETETSCSIDAARRALAAADGVELVDDPATATYPMPNLAEGRGPVLVGRVRASHVFANGLSFFLSGDQLLKGAALNTVQIARALQT